MNTSATVGAIGAAMAKAQAAMKNAVFNKVNPHFKSKYADLASVRDAITPALTGNGIAVIQTTELDKNGVFIVRTTLIHSSGEWISSEYPITSDTNKPQAMGSAMTYARRYGLSAICGIASEEDDDGNEAADHGAKAPEARNLAGTTGASKAKGREVYTTLIAEMHKAPSIDALKEWLNLRRPDIEKLPADWIEEFDVAYSEHKDSLKARAS